MIFRKPHVIFAMSDPEALRRATEALDGRRVRISVAPTTDLLARALREAPGRVVLDPGSFREGAVPMAHLEPVLAGAVSLAAFLADPEGVLRTGAPQRMSALPSGLYVVAGAGGGVGATAAALGLHQALLAQGERAALLELPGPGRPSALRARELAADAAGMILAGAPPAPEVVALGLEGPAAAALWAERPEALLAFLDRLGEAFRLVVVDLSPDFPGADAVLARAVRSVVLMDLRPEAEALAAALSARHAGVLRALVARWGEGGGIPHEVRLDPPPRPDRWGQALARALLRSVLGGR